MKKYLLLIIIIPFMLQAQHYTNWNGYFSYNNVVAMHYANDKIYAAAENSVFSYDSNSGNITTKSTIDGLSGEEISSIHYSTTYQKTIIGYKNGLIEIVDNDPDVAILTIVDIVNKTNIPATAKSVNHILEYNGMLYLSCGYGISLFNLDQLLFGDTYYIGAGGAQIQVNETAIFNNELFAATQNDGIIKADLNNPFLIDFANWTQVQTGTWKGIAAYNNDIIAIAYNRLFKYNGSIFAQEHTFPSTVKSLQITTNNATIALNTEAFVFDANYNIVQHQSTVTDYDDFTINTAFAIGQDLYLATNKYGLLKSETNNATTLEEIHPDGPLRNSIFSIEALANEFWVTYGAHTVYYNPYPTKSRGLSHYKNDTWLNIKFDDLLGARNLVKTTTNPNNQSQVFVSSFIDGLLVLNDEVATDLYTNLNSPLQDLTPLIPNDVRCGVSAFDSNGLLWTTTTLTPNGLYSFDPETTTWQAYSVTDITPAPVADHAEYGALVIDDNNVKWLATPYHGVIGYDTSSNQIKNIRTGSDGGLPVIDVRSLAIDKNNTLWIGTLNGLVILRNLAGFFDDPDPQAEPIVILDEGIPKLLLDQQWISDIVVDGDNNKWFATQDAGVFYTSADGKQLIHHFTKDNSPLPTNGVDDISLDASTGEVFFATSKGLVSFNGVATEPADNLDNAYVFPNPVRPNYQGLVTIKNLIADANVKITDITGNLVYEAISEGGVLQWDLHAFGTHRVASGVYLVHIISKDAAQTKLLKLMIVN